MTGVQTCALPILEPEGANLDDLQWSSSDSSVASVSYGYVNAESAGTATITATASNGVSASISVKVGTYVPVDYLSIVGNGTITVGGSTDLSLVINPDNATNRQAEWEVASGGSKIVSVSGSGTSATVTGRKKGTATVIAYINDNGQVKQASISITVTDKVVEPSELEFVDGNGDLISFASLAVGRGDSLLKLLQIGPEGASTEGLVWSSSDPSVATVEDGQIQGISDGVATITVKAPNGATATLTVKVGNGNAAPSQPVNPPSSSSSVPEQSSSAPEQSSSTPEESSSKAEDPNPPEEGDPNPPPEENPGGEGEGGEDIPPMIWN